uniref:C-type lectin domain-containing protein n=1 Tax=Cyprinus carpio TaxID=7962 RepID=A0A8C1JD85_CYPCA
MAILRSLLLLCIVFSNVDVNLAEKCPYGWTNFGVQCYKFFPQTVNMITAERNCQSLDSNLASAHNKMENDFLLSLLPSSSTRSWIGAHDAIQEGQWGDQNQQAQDKGEGQRKEAYTVQFLYWTFRLLPEASQILLRQAVV